MKFAPKSHGFVVGAAIVLLVILSALGAFLLTVSNVQKVTFAQDIQGSRAYWMATAGIQWVAAAINASAVGGVGSCPTPMPTLTLDGFTINITCTQNTYTEGMTAFNVYWLTATATIGGQVGSLAYTERMITTFDF